MRLCLNDLFLINYLAVNARYSIPLRHTTVKLENTSFEFVFKVLGPQCQSRHNRYFCVSLALQSLHAGISALGIQGKNPVNLAVSRSKAGYIAGPTLPIGFHTITYF